jgi:protein involved in polysaccharide export with SLBB domain
MTPEDPLAVGDCLVLEVKDRGSVPPWRRTIDAEGYFSAPLGQRVKIAGKTLTEAADLIAERYVQSILGPPRLALMRCEEYNRKKLGSK